MSNSGGFGPSAGALGIEGACGKAAVDCGEVAVGFAGVAAGACGRAAVVCGGGEGGGAGLAVCGLAGAEDRGAVAMADCRCGAPK